MEVMKIGGILLLVGLALWIIKSVFVWWRERHDTKKWWGNTRRKQTHGTRGASWRAITKARMTVHVGDENSPANLRNTPKSMALSNFRSRSKTSGNQYAFIRSALPQSSDVSGARQHFAFVPRH
jgi:hypothetical protein